ncbi:hypothetical protein ACOSW8_004542, partial [Salmonella enterica subsp. enterica serovar Enteritidis]
ARLGRPSHRTAPLYLQKPHKTLLMNFEAMNSHAPQWMIAVLNLFSGLNWQKIRVGPLAPL